LARQYHGKRVTLERAKHLRPKGKRQANKKLRKSFKMRGV